MITKKKSTNYLKWHLCTSKIIKERQRGRKDSKGGVRNSKETVGVRNSKSSIILIPKDELKIGQVRFTRHLLNSLFGIYTFKMEHVKGQNKSQGRVVKTKTNKGSRKFITKI